MDSQRTSSPVSSLVKTRLAFPCSRSSWICCLSILHTKKEVGSRRDSSQEFRMVGFGGLSFKSMEKDWISLVTNSVWGHSLACDMISRGFSPGSP